MSSFTTWLLIVIHGTAWQQSGARLHTERFQDEKSCMVAGEIIAKELNDRSIKGISWRCIKS